MKHISTSRTDLAVEAQELVTREGQALPGVHSETDEDDGIFISRIHVTNEEGSQILGKRMGHYITIEVPGLRQKDSDLQGRVSRRFAQEFEWLLHQLKIPDTAKVLIIGLGNGNVTPDALGPLVVSSLLVTRHYFELMPDKVAKGIRPVSAVAPGVLGTTGMETTEIVQGIVEKTNPDLVIAVDALASRTLRRVNTTLQMADTGIHPGSGIGNRRLGLTQETLGVPCLAIGVPTVVYASTIVNNSFQMVLEHFRKQTENTEFLFGELDKMSEQERLHLVREVLSPLGQDLLVTPKEIDEFMEDIANLIAAGLNMALHEAVTEDNVSAYTH